MHVYIHWKDWCWSWNANTLTTSCKELTHWKRPWCWEEEGAGREADDREWDGWMASPTWWTWVWVNSGSLWWTGRPGMLWFMGLQRVGHNWATELNWTDAFYHIGIYDRFPYCGKLHFSKLDVMAFSWHALLWSGLDISPSGGEISSSPLKCGLFLVSGQQTVVEVVIWDFQGQVRGGCGFHFPFWNSHSSGNPPHLPCPRPRCMATSRAGALLSSPAGWPAGTSLTCPPASAGQPRYLQLPERPQTTNWAWLNHRALRDLNQLLFGATKLWDGLFCSDRELENYLKKYTYPRSRILNMNQGIFCPQFQYYFQIKSTFCVLKFFF